MELRLEKFAVANRDLTASITREGDWYVVQCIELDVVSQGESAVEALENLREAIELHFEAI
jgi:predicted RNase H-like HicB family nuclease